MSPSPHACVCVCVSIPCQGAAKLQLKVPTYLMEELMR